MFRIVNKDHIASLTVLRDPRKGIFNISFRRWMVTTVVHENQHFALVEAVHISEKPFDVHDIVVATTKLSLLTRVINSNKNGASPSRRSGWNNVHCLVDINHSRTGQLRHLVEPHAIEDASHSPEAFHPTHGTSRMAFFIENLKYGGSTGTTGSSLLLRFQGKARVSITVKLRLNEKGGP